MGGRRERKQLLLWDVNISSLIQTQFLTLLICSDGFILMVVLRVVQQMETLAALRWSVYQMFQQSSLKLKINVTDTDICLKGDCLL